MTATVTSITGWPVKTADHVPSWLLLSDDEWRAECWIRADLARMELFLRPGCTQSDAARYAMEVADNLRLKTRGAGEGGREFLARLRTHQTWMRERLIGRPRSLKTKES